MLAVAQALSEQGILNRYLEQVRDRGQGRLTVPEKAQASYTGIPESCEVIVREGLVGFAAVYRRGESPPGSRPTPPNWPVKLLALRQAVERERNRPANRRGEPRLPHRPAEAAYRPARRLRPAARPDRRTGRAAPVRPAAGRGACLLRCRALPQHHPLASPRRRPGRARRPRTARHPGAAPKDPSSAGGARSSHPARSTAPRHPGAATTQKQRAAHDDHHGDGPDGQPECVRCDITELTFVRAAATGWRYVQDRLACGHCTSRFPAQMHHQF